MQINFKNFGRFGGAFFPQTGMFMPDIMPHHSPFATYLTSCHMVELYNVHRLFSNTYLQRHPA